MKELILKVNEDGSCEIEVKGAKGKECMQITKEIEEAMGVVADRKYKPEFNLVTTDSFGNSQNISASELDRYNFSQDVKKYNWCG